MCRFRLNHFQGTSGISKKNQSCIRIVNHVHSLCVVTNITENTPIPLVFLKYQMLPADDLIQIETLYSSLCTFINH